jgi:hypothetical protein
VAETPSDPSDPTAPSDAERRRSPVDHLVDYCVFAPLGLALEARTLMPGLIDRGRAQVGVARMVGEFAVKWGSVKLESSVVDAQEQAMGVLRRTGLAPAEERDRGPEPRTAPATPAAAPDTDPRPAEPVGPEVDVATLAIPDYDNLSASQVVPRLDGLTPSELRAVGDYERGHRGRKTILNKVAQLENPEG